MILNLIAVFTIRFLKIKKLHQLLGERGNQQNSVQDSVSPFPYSKNQTSCVQSLLENGHAILANSSLSEKSISFRILLHPLTIDKYITRKILTKGTYEPDMEEFIAHALPLNATYENSTKTKMPSSQNLAHFNNDCVWAVDIGANIGFHSIHMARRGVNVISFEPAPNTTALLKCTVSELLSLDNSDSVIRTGGRQKGSASGSIRVIEAGASDVKSEGKMVRHPDSPGMTTFGGANTSFPMEELKNRNAAEGNATSSAASITTTEVSDNGKIKMLRLRMF